MTKPLFDLSESLFSMGSVINTAFPLGAKGEYGFGKFAEASPPAPDFTAESSRNYFSQKFGKKFDFGDGGNVTLSVKRWWCARKHLLDFGPVGAKDDHSQIPFEWVGWSSYCLVAIVTL